MDKSVEKQIKKFVSLPVRNYFTGIIGFICFLVVGIFSISWLFVLVAVFFGVYCLWFYFVKIAAANKKINAIFSSSESRILVNDFQNAGRAFNGRVIMGDRYIIPKEGGFIYSYSEIIYIWQIIQFKNGVVGSHDFYIVDKNGKKRQIFSIPRQYYEREEYQSVIGYILSKNPNIKLGEP